MNASARSRAGFATLAAAALVSGLVGVNAAAAVTGLPAADAAPSAAAATPGSPSSATVADLQHAAVTEAFAYASYRAYATQADADHDPVAARVWRTIADVEYHDHFVKEGEQSGLVGTNRENVTAALRSERQAQADYRRWIADARAAGCTSVAKALREIRRDEAGHARLLEQALGTVRSDDGTGDAPVPVGPSSTPVATRRTAPACADATVAADLADALNSEATAWAQYDQWADHAANTGSPRLAALFAAIGAVELEEHFATEANLAGLVGDRNHNLAASIASEQDAIMMYARYATAADARGDATAADLFREVRGDEQGHLRSFQALRGE